MTIDRVADDATRKSEVVDADQSFYDKVNAESDRGCVLVAAAFIDEALTDLLAADFKKLSVSSIGSAIWLVR